MAISPLPEVAQQVRTRAAGMPPGQQRDAHAERIEPGGEVARMLLREQFGRCHERRLFAVLRRRARPRARRRRSCPSPRRPARSRIIGCVRPRSCSISCHVRCWAPVRRNGNACNSRPSSSPRGGNAQARSQVEALRSKPQAQLVRQQFLERQSTLRRVTAGVQLVEIGVGRRPMHEPQCRIERRQFERSRVRRGPASRAAPRRGARASASVVRLRMRPC